MENWIEELLKRIPDYKEFLTVDEMNDSSKRLAAKHPDIVEEFLFGESRNGEKIIGLKIGNGSKNALMFGLPHPNEPIGTMMLEFFTQELAENSSLREKLDYTWYIIKAWDVDGTRLNENWFKGPYNFYNYARNFFRPAGHQQVDWTFPVDYKDLHFSNTIPETKAMMELIDKIQPTFIYSLHNAGFGGVYWYLTDDIFEVYDELKYAAKRQNIPLSLGEPEAPFCEAFAPAIYKELGIKDNYDYLEKNGIDNISKVIKVGTCSADYAHGKYDSFTMLTELPYFYSDKITDLSEGSQERGQAIRDRIAESKIHEEKLLSSFRKTKEYMAEANPFKLALEAFTENEEDDRATINMTYTDDTYKKKATVAEEFDNKWISQFYKMLSYGLLIRANEFELESMEKTAEDNSDKKKALQEEVDRGLSALKELSEYLEANIDYQVVPIKKLVSIQLEAGLIIADYLQKNK